MQHSSSARDPVTSYVARDMASQVVGEGPGSCYEWLSYVRGYHEYKDVWTLTLKAMWQLKVEPTNPHDQLAVAVIKPERLSITFPSMSVELFYFLSRRL